MIGIREKIGYGFGDMASSMFWKLFGSYLMIFYTDVFGMPACSSGGHDVSHHSCLGLGVRPYNRDYCRPDAIAVGKVSSLSVVSGYSVRCDRCADFYNS